MKQIVALSLFVAGFASGQTSHFPDLEWKEKDLDHFTIRTKSTGTDPARRYSEKTYEVMLEILPGLEGDFEKNEFRTPGGQEAGKEDRFRFTTYLVETGHDFHSCVMIDAKRHNWSNGNVQITKQVGNYLDQMNRYLVICKSDPEQSGGGREKDRKEILVHSLGTALMKSRTHQADLPFWMTAGMGYYAEHMVFDRCSIYYLDFEAYYRQNPDAKVDARKGGTLGPQESWPRILRKLCKGEKRVSLEKTLGAQIVTLSPNESGYIFALNYFMVSTNERTKKYQGFITSIRTGAKPTKDLLLKTMGYGDDASFEKDWYEWMMSSKFK
ncbi:MAG: hypothetical protein P8Q54_00400 [Akkermansiaceae bacterium]|nr:hypothetical protein [Akkermansiaceae bacterium]MDG1361907.1 hypothetical protein [Akkermansiaceae bacterium]